MQLDRVFDDIINDLPWVEHHRLIVGALTSRESVKDALLERTPIIPAWAIGTLAEFATEILTKAGRTVEKPLSAASQCDALERIARTDFLKKALPDFCTHLRSRGVALKISRFLTQLDRFYANSGELSAVIEYFETKDQSLGTFLGLVGKLWEQGELSPWSDGCLLRAAIEEMGEVKLPETVTLWGFAEFTPLEELFLERLAQAGVHVRFLVPENLMSAYEARCKDAHFEALAQTEASPKVAAWEPHSIWDELEFLRDALSELRLKDVPWNEIAVFVPNDDLYKRFARQKLHEWNVPLHDPTLSGGWKDKPRWLWWRDMLRIISSGLKLEDVRAWLGPARDREALLKSAFEQGVHGGAKQWSNLLAKHEMPELRLLVETMPMFARTMLPAEFLKACEKLIPRAEELLGAENLESSLILDFARHLCEQRPYLEDFKARLPRYVSLFEEYLEVKSRAESARSSEGLRFVGHGVWLPTRARHAFVLGTNLILRPKPGADVWDWEGQEVSRAWEKLHFGMAWADRVKRDEALFSFGLKSTSSLVVSAVDYDAKGKPVGKNALYRLLIGEAKPKVVGGHDHVGWLLSTAPEPMAEKVTVLRPDVIDVAKPVSVSAFEDYLKCPFMYYARHLLKLESEDELGLDPNGRARGILLHSVLGRFIEDELKGLHALNERDVAAARLSTLVDEEIASEMKAGRTLPGLFRHKPLIEKTRAVIKSHVLRWLDWEIERRKKFPTLKPFAVESPVELELEGLKVRGRADRVDADGKHSVVIDYKTGEAPFIGGELSQGIGAQLVMYAKGMQKSHGLEPAAAYYLTVGRKVEGKSGVFLKGHSKNLHDAHARNSGVFDGDFATLFEKVSENWRRAAADLSNGIFSPNPARPKKDCSICRYEPVCGHKQSTESLGDDGE